MVTIPLVPGQITELLFGRELSRQFRAIAMQELHHHPGDSLQPNDEGRHDHQTVHNDATGSSGSSSGSSCNSRNSGSSGGSDGQKRYTRDTNDILRQKRRGMAQTNDVRRGHANDDMHENCADVNDGAIHDAIDDDLYEIHDECQRFFTMDAVSHCCIIRSSLCQQILRLSVYASI